MVTIDSSTDSAINVRYLPTGLRKPYKARMKMFGSRNSGYARA